MEQSPAVHHILFRMWIRGTALKMKSVKHFRDKLGRGFKTSKCLDSSVNTVCSIFTESHQTTLTRFIKHHDSLRIHTGKQSLWRSYRYTVYQSDISGTLYGAVEEGDTKEVITQNESCWAVAAGGETHVRITSQWQNLSYFNLLQCCSWNLLLVLERFLVEVL